MTTSHHPEWHPGQQVPDGYHEVHPHIRKNPGRAQPHWIVFDTRTFCFLTRIRSRGNHGWTEPKDYIRAKPFLKNDLKRAFKNEHEAGEVDWLYVG